ncbi:MAG: HEPN domain-containing protein [Tepidisphaeraceae bacterium]|jgi:hypothetical protein
MSSTPVGPTTPNPRQIFLVAEQFYRIVGIVLKEMLPEDRAQIVMEGDTPYKIAPIIAMCAFSFELYLKCLIVLDGGAPPRLHDLEKLFAQLNPRRKAEVEEKYDEERRTSPLSGGDDYSANRVLARSKEAFESHRYIYEFENPRSADSWMCQKLANVVRDIIIKQCPEWLPPPFQAVPG